MDLQYLDDYDKDVKLRFNLINGDSPEFQIRQVYDMLKTHEKNRIQLLGNPENLLDYIPFMENIQDGLYDFYYVYKGNTLYSYIKTIGTNRVHIISFYSSKIKIVSNITKLLLDFIVYLNLSKLEKLVLPYEFDTTDEYLQRWLMPDKIYDEVQIEWGDVNKPNRNKRYDITKNNLEYKIEECFPIWEEIFSEEEEEEEEEIETKSIEKISSLKSKNLQTGSKIKLPSPKLVPMVKPKSPVLKKVASIKSPEYEKQIMQEFEHVKFIKEDEKTLVCKVSRKDAEEIVNIREIIFYKNLNNPHIPLISKINRVEFCLPKYYPLKVDKTNIKEFMRQILEGLDYIHSKGICHQDIKPINMLQDKAGQNYYIIDFGIAQFYGFSNLRKAYFSTRGYVIENKDFNNDTGVDIFSLGMSIIKILTNHPGSITNKKGEKYFETSEDILKSLSVYKSIIINTMGNDGYDLLLDMVGLGDYGDVDNPKLITASDALNHEYFGKKYVPYPVNFRQIKPFININFDEVLSYKNYILLMDWILEVLIGYNYTYITFLLTVQIFRKLINLHLMKSKNDLRLYTTASLIIACIINQSDQQILEDINTFPEGENRIKNAIFEILKALNYEIELIPYDFYVKNENPRIIFYFVYILGFYKDNINLNLEELSRDVGKYYKDKKMVYIATSSILENVRERAKKDL